MEKLKGEEWRAKILENDEVDVLKVDSRMNYKTWCKGLVVSREEDILKIEFHNDRKMYDRVLNAYSPDVAELGKFSHENDWKKDVKEGSELDALDNAKVWYCSTVLEVSTMKEDDREVEIIKVGFRVYNPNGHKKDK